MTTIELNSTNCKEYSNEELEKMFDIETLESLEKKLKKNIAQGKKVEYKSESFWKLVAEESQIKETIVELYGADALLDILLCKKRIDGKFVSKNSKGDTYGN